MKIFSFACLLFCLFNLYGALGFQTEVSQFYMMTKFHMFYSFNVTSGELLKSQNAANPKYFIYGSIMANAAEELVYFLATDSEYQKDFIISYDIKNNSFTPIKSIEGTYGGYQWSQIIAWDPNLNFAALPAAPMNVEKPECTIFVWNFTASEMQSITLPTGEMFMMTAGDYPVGYYDINTGNYYIIYISNKDPYTKGTTLIVYNMWTQKVVQDPIYFNIKLYVPAIFYVNGQLYLMETAPQIDYQIYTVDITAQTLTQKFTIANNLKNPSNFGMVYGMVGNSVSLFSSATPNHYTNTVVDLEGLEVFTSPSYQSSSLDIQFEWVSGAF